MPAASKKNLYLSTSVGGLNKLAEVKFERGISLKSYCNSANKLYKAALEHGLLGDEEKAYVLYMKYFNLYGHIRKSKDFKKEESYYAKLMGSSNAKKAIEEAEKLSKSLNNRYDLKADAEKAQKVAEELEVLRDSSGKDDKVTISPSDDVGSFFPYVPVDKLSSSGVYSLLKVGEKTPLSPEKSHEPDDITKALKETGSVKDSKPGFISAEQLYNMFQDKDTSFLIMDVRLKDQYGSSHIKHDASINIPAEIIKPGTTVSVLEKGLPEDIRRQWDRRGQVDHIILVDWEGTSEHTAVGSTLQSLKDAMFKWDSVTIIKSEPLVLEGGFDNWLFTYPMYTTNPSIQRPPAYSQQQQQDIMSLDFDYPTLDDENEEPKMLVQKKDERSSPDGRVEPFPASTANQSGPTTGPVSATASQVDTQEPTDILKPSPPLVNRATKPVVKVPPSSPKHQKPPSTMNGTAGQAVTEDSFVQPGTTQTTLPQVDRRTKPKISLDKTSESDKASGPSEAELRISELAKMGLEKIEAERRKIEEEKQRIEEEKRKLEAERLQHIRDMQEKEEEKKLELEKIEEEKRARDKQLEKLRRQKQEKLKQEKDAQEKREEELEKKRQEQERARQLEEEEKKAQELENSKKREAEKKAQEEKEEAERAQQLKREQEKLSREKAEKARQEELARAEKEKQERLRQEAARKEEEEQERQERIQKQQQRDREFARLEADKSSAGPKSHVTSPGLPSGWEKVLDQQTGRYYYKDHNTASTHWNLPQSILNRSPGSVSGTYTVSLQDEPQGGKGKLRRSHSSPNIAQMVSDELVETKKVPKVDRKGKPEIVRAPKVKPESAEVQAARLRNMQPVFGGQGRGLTGLRNLGNTCYMNSVIQSLCAATLLSEYFLRETYKFDINRENKLGCNGEIAEEFAAVIKALWSGQYRSIAPRDFKCSVGKYNSQFANFNQQDSQEFLLFLMDGLHEDMNRVKKREYIQEEDQNHLPDVTRAERAWQNHKRLNQSIIVELFQGQFKSTLQCLRCHNTSSTFEAFMYLSLPIPSSGRCKLQECVQTFTKSEKVSGSDKWYCSRCKTHREAVKKIEIWKLPPFLLIHLKRFKYEGVWRQKLNTNVDFPLSSFDMRPFIVGPKPQPHYKLFAVSNHYGTMEGGHYTAFCRNTSNRKWYKFDDHEVNELSTSSVQSSAAYILFYSAMELQPPNQTSF